MQKQDLPHEVADADEYAQTEPLIQKMDFATLCQRIKEDWHAHNRDWTLPGFRAIAVCRFGQWRMSIKNPLIRKCLSFIYQVLYRRARNVYGIEIPYTIQLGRRVVIEHQGSIVIHGYVSIGNDCIIRQGVTLGNRYPEKPLDCPKLDDNVSIGAGAKLLGDVRVGKGAIIGANALVLHHVPEKTTVVGIPAKPLIKK